MNEQKEKNWKELYVTHLTSVHTARSHEATWSVSVGTHIFCSIFANCSPHNVLFIFFIISIIHTSIRPDRKNQWYQIYFFFLSYLKSFCVCIERSFFFFIENYFICSFAGPSHPKLLMSHTRKPSKFLLFCLSWMQTYTKNYPINYCRSVPWYTQYTTLSIDC